MKRFLVCLGWYVLMSNAILFVGGFIVGMMTAGDPNATGYSAGYNFGATYGPIIQIGSFVVAVIGTLTGLLPHTKKEQQ